jgi:hypothetical protein
MEIEKLFNSKTVELKRSEIHLSDYNPRKISEEGKKQLKRSIKRYGVVGGIVVNSATGNTVVGGHQKVAILDELAKGEDYKLKVELIAVDAKTEKQLNIVLNNPNIGGGWDYSRLRELIPDIDYKDAGLTDEDLSLVGLDNLFKTEEENNLADSLNDMMQPVEDEHKEEIDAKKAAKVAHMKDVKAQVKDNAQKKAEDMDAYVMLSFDNYDSKVAFMQRLGYDVNAKFIKGEDLDSKVEIILED